MGLYSRSNCSSDVARHQQLIVLCPYRDPDFDAPDRFPIKDFAEHHDLSRLLADIYLHGQYIIADLGANIDVVEVTLVYPG